MQLNGEDAEAKIQETVEQLRQRIAAEPGVVSHYLQLCSVLSRAGRWREVIEVCSQCLGDGRLICSIYTLRGLAHGKLELYPQATEDFSAALELDPNDVNALLNRSILWTKLKEWQSVIDDSSRLIQVRPSFHQAYINRGIAQHKLNNNELALRDFDFVIQDASLDSMKVTHLLPRRSNS